MSRVLIVDDRPDEVTLTAELNQASGMKARALHPEQLELTDLREADLVLVDYQLEDPYWSERSRGPVSRQPADGLALATLLRRHVHGSDRESPTAFAILTSEIARLAFPLPAENREHVLARLNNLEWVFQKSSAGKQHRLGEQVIGLANAVKALPNKWPKNDSAESEKQLLKVLGLSDECDGREQLLEDVADCLPPIHELSEWSHGLAVLRWFLHRILPYPSFLWDSYHLAARLRVDHKWLLESLQSDTGLAKWLSSARYEGLLSDFAGQRWWRSSVEQLLWIATEQRSFSIEDVYKAVSAKHGKDAKPSSPADHPIVCVNSDFQPLEYFSIAQDCVRIRPDDWPSYADQAWTTIELAKSESRLGALVISEDKEKLNDS